MQPKVAVMVTINATLPRWSRLSSSDIMAMIDRGKRLKHAGGGPSTCWSTASCWEVLIMIQYHPMMLMHVLGKLQRLHNLMLGDCSMFHV
jgi:hypothetical protein